MATRSKNVNGDGSVYRRDAGYEAAITVNGKRRTQRAGTRAEAEAALRRLRAQRDTGQLPRKADSSAGQFLAYWLELQKPRLRYSTWRRYCELVLGKATPVIGGIPLVRLGAIHLEDLYSKCFAAGSSASTVLHLHRALHKALADAESWDLVDSNVARRVRPPRVRQAPPEVLNVTQVARLIAASRDHPLGAAFILAVTSGLRQGELLGLRWSDVDLEPGGVASIRQTVQRAARGRVLGDPKTERSRRDVEILKIAREALLAHHRRQAAQRLAATGWAEPDRVFTDENGVPLNPARVSRQFRRLMDELGMDIIPFKNLRHTFATLHLDTGVSDKILSEAMGHSRPSTTNTYYRRVERSHQQAAAGRLENLLREVSPDGVAGGVAGAGA